MGDRYESDVSSEPLGIIRANECESNIGSLCTMRFRRLWNEIVDLREQLAAKQSDHGIPIHPTTLGPDLDRSMLVDRDEE